MTLNSVVVVSKLLMSEMGSFADVLGSARYVRKNLDCVAKLPLRRSAKRDSVRLSRSSTEAAHDGGQGDGQGQFFYAFDLDEVVPPDHLARQIDAMLDLSWVHKEFAPYYSHTGRPSIDPVLMIRMLIVGYVFAIRSERNCTTAPIAKMMAASLEKDFAVMTNLAC